MSYRQLQVWQLAREIVIDVHKLTLKKLPKFETGSLVDEPMLNDLHKRLHALGGKLNRFIQGVEREHRSVREEPAEYEVTQ